MLLITEKVELNRIHSERLKNSLGSPGHICTTPLLDIVKCSGFTSLSSTTTSEYGLNPRVSA